MYSHRTLGIKLVSDKMFLKLEQRDINYLSSLSWDDLTYHLENKFGVKFRENFIDHLADTLEELMGKGK